jgi:hypothetical protein
MKCDGLIFQSYDKEFKIHDCMAGKVEVEVRPQMPTLLPVKIKIKLIRKVTRLIRNRARQRGTVQT